LKRGLTSAEMKKESFTGRNDSMYESERSV